MTKIILKSSDDMYPKFEILPAGSYMARCYQIIDLGTHDSEWEGVVKKRHTIRFSFEFPTKTSVFNPEKGEQPFILSKTFTYSMHSKGKLRPFLEIWRGKPISDPELSEGVDMDQFLGKPLFVSVGHIKRADGEDFATILSHMPIPDGMECPPAINEALMYSVASPDNKVFDKLSKYTQEQILNSDEMSINTNPPTPAPGVVTKKKVVTAVPEPTSKVTIDDVPFSPNLK